MISHLIEQKYSAPEILIECVMYGAAGIATTREFVCAAAWHLLEDEARQKWYVGAEQGERYAFLHELLRLEPVVGHLFRRTTGDLPLEQAGQAVVIPAGALINLHLYAINSDAAVVGAQPQQLCPGRPMSEARVPPDAMGFGDGHHRCAGAFVAIQTTDIFLQELLALPGLRLQRPPHLGWNAVASGYELRDFILRAG